MEATQTHDPNEQIAIIGLAGRLPGAENLERFWEKLRDGAELISFFSDHELRATGVPAELIENPKYVKAAGYLENIDLFDAPFFGYSPREAEIIDPQQRIFLECAWEALENAGYNPDEYDGRIGVFAGASASIYTLRNLASNPDLVEAVGSYQVMLGNDKDYLTTRVSYKLNLKGPSITVQSSCSTSLVATHLACQSLLNGETDMTLAGGVSIDHLEKHGYLYKEGGIASPDGHCRAFDARAMGTVGGSGVGIVVLKRLSDALADRDYIRAIIKGSAVNNDGSLKVGFTAPSVDGQAAVIEEALAMAMVDAESISYVEAHGTGTVLGDPIEIAALTKAFRKSTNKRGFCAIGSVKTNVGHLDAAAGVAGLIKTTLALENKLAPPSLHFERPNPKIDLEDSPFYVNTKLSSWESNGSPRRAGVNSLGIGGTNAHVILEEAPAIGPSSESRSHQLIVLSARTATANERAASNLIARLKANHEINLADLAYTLQVGRKSFPHRLMLVCKDVQDAVTALEQRDAVRVLSSCQENENRSVLFMFPGQGSQHLDMGLGLYQSEPTFRDIMDELSERFEPHLGLDLREVIYPAVEKREDASKRLDQTQITQPALFIVEYALARLWMEWGVEPASMIGHSLGEYVAATIAGVFSLEDALALVAARGRLMQRMPAGAMLGVRLSERELKPMLKGGLDLAAVNGPNQCVASGGFEAIEALRKELESRKVDCRRLQTSHAFHSEMMEPAAKEFAELAQRVKLHPPAIPFISNLTGKQITAAEATDPMRWARHLRQKVNFADGISGFINERAGIMLEIGPGQTLSNLARTQLGRGAAHAVIASLRGGDSKSDALLESLGRLWLAGARIDWKRFHRNERRHRIPLPSYPFERQRYWVEPSDLVFSAKKRHRSLDKNPDIADWFYAPLWKQTALPIAESVEPETTWLVFTGEDWLSLEIVGRMKEAGINVISVSAGTRSSKIQDGAYVINARERDDYNFLFREVRAAGGVPQKIIHLWGLNGNKDHQESSFYSLLFLARAIGEQLVTTQIDLKVFTSNMQLVTGMEELCPERATQLGPCRVIPQEYPNITCYSIDVDEPRPGSAYAEKLVRELISEATAKTSDLIVAYRGNLRWAQVYEPIKLKRRTAPRLKEEGVYLITGGLGSIGLSFSDYLARTRRAKLILVGRSNFPSRSEWDQWLATRPAQDATTRRIRRLKAIEQAGAEILLATADVADESRMRAVIDLAYEKFGRLDGVIHAAGTVGEAAAVSIQETDPGTCERLFRAKVEGVGVLGKLLEGRDLDFCLLMSSLASVLGGLGFFASAAADNFMDAFAARHNQKSLVPWISVNWDGWRITDEDLDHALDAPASSEIGITPREGVQALELVLAQDACARLVVSTADLKSRVDRWIKREFLRAPDTGGGKESLSLHPRPALQNSYVAPRDEVEQTVADIWQKLLGIDEVGVYDSLFDLGGDSLLAIQIISRLREAFHLEISLRSVFDAPTVAAISDNIRSGSKEAEQDAEEISDVLDLIECLSDEEARLLLAGEADLK